MEDGAGVEHVRDGHWHGQSVAGLAPDFFASCKLQTSGRGVVDGRALADQPVTCSEER